MNTIMKQIRTIPLLVLGLVLSAVASQAQQTLTLKQALNYAVQNNVNARKAKLDIDGGKYKTQEVRAQALPQINASTSLNYNPIIGQLVVNNGGNAQAFSLGRAWDSNAGIQLSQQLFNQQVFTGLQAARSSEEYYRLSSELTDEQVIELVANNYYQVLVARQRLNVIDTNLKNIRVVENIITTQYNNGLAKKIDVDRIKVSITNLETQRTQVINSITQLELQLKLSMGMPVETAITLPRTELNESVTLPEMSDTLNLDNRTEVKLLDVQDRLLALQRKAYVSEYYPNLSLSGNYTYSSQANRFDYLTSNGRAIGFDASSIGITLRIPVFNGFLTRSRIRQADVDIKKANEDRRQTTNALNTAYENAKIELRNSISTIESQRKNAELANEIYQSTQNNYNNGLASLTDLLDTENALTEAQNAYTQALLNYKVAEIQLIKSNGNIKSLLQ